LRLSPDEARAAVELFGSQRAAARALGIPPVTLWGWVNPERMAQHRRAWRERNPERNRQSVRDSKRKERTDPAHRKREAQWSRERREGLRDQGLCTKCGKEPLLSDTRCWDCLNKMEEYRAIRF
jgi:hypothetical protein